ncbi:MAG: MBOAT, membrane-bound O-acyltransferase family-domain-containing protein [Piptocephalis tieghemiana]|nr:MAG: MBOAT, membrane-bound O-acyltransferase family-domain-containing protein [Piptocephalis tieghemiana]
MNRVARRPRSNRSSPPPSPFSSDSEGSPTKKTPKVPPSPSSSRNEVDSAVPTLASKEQGTDLLPSSSATPTTSSSSSLSSTTSALEHETFTRPSSGSRPHGSIQGKSSQSPVRQETPTSYTYCARNSIFDRMHMIREDNPLRGFFTLFWVSMGLYVLLTAIRSWEERGYLLGGDLFSILSRDLVSLLLSDIVLVLAMTPAFFLAKISSWGLIPPWKPLEMTLQHSYQALYLLGALYYTHQQQWPWVQRTFFSMHTMVLTMKIHSYITQNTHFRHLRRSLKRMLKEEKEVREELQADGSLVETDTSSGKKGNWWFMRRTRLQARRPFISSLPDSTSFDPSSSQEVTRLAGTSEEDESETGGDEAARKGPAVSPAEAALRGRLEHLRKDIARTEVELCPGTVAYPNNLTLANWVDYVLIPSLVYEIHFPRTDRIRPWYVFEKALATFGSMFLMYVTMEQSLIPSIKYAATTSLLYALPHLMFPFLITFLLGFFIVFECVCNGFAELTHFADRRFYDDWWNSSTWDEFARKWNRPVHLFLLRHVYFPLRHGLGLPKVQANFYTFLFSALAHELAVWIMAGRLRMFFFGMQMLQIPLVYYSQRAKDHVKAWGNGVFWVSMMLGPSMMTFVYTRDHYLELAASGPV